MERQFSAVYVRDGDWWVAYVEELPGAHTQGKTLDEARENLMEAIVLILGANREIAVEQARGRETIRETMAVALG